MGVDFCNLALEETLSLGRPEIFNTDRVGPFTIAPFTGVVRGQGIQISMDGKGRYLENILVEWLWRNVKYEETYLSAYGTGAEARNGIDAYLDFYNWERRHQALSDWTPAQMIIEEPTNKCLQDQEVVPPCPNGETLPMVARD